MICRSYAALLKFKWVARHEGRSQIRNARRSPAHIRRHMAGKHHARHALTRKGEGRRDQPSNAACAAASRAIGTLKGEQLT